MEQWTVAELIENLSDDPDDLVVKVKVGEQQRDITLIDYGTTEDGTDAVLLVADGGES